MAAINAIPAETGALIAYVISTEFGRNVQGSPDSLPPLV